MSAYPPSNGTMGAMWMDAWCFRCINDHGYSHSEDENPDKGCRLIVRSMTEDGPFDWLRDEQNYDTQRGWDPAKLVCSNFERCPCQDDLGWEPAPDPDPNQGLLFDVLPDSPVTPGGVVVFPVASEVSA